jgi:hypothetical protein
MIYADLKPLWDERDRRYETIRYPLSSEQVSAIRRFRYAEALEVGMGQITALTRAMAFQPPERKEPRRVW